MRNGALSSEDVYYYIKYFQVYSPAPEQLALLNPLLASL